MEPDKDTALANGPAICHQPAMKPEARATDLQTTEAHITVRRDNKSIFQVVCGAQVWRALHGAFAMVTSFRAPAATTTLCGFPAVLGRFPKVFKDWAVMGCDERGLEHEVPQQASPPPIAYFPRSAPLSCARGARPARAVACSPVI